MMTFDDDLDLNAMFGIVPTTAGVPGDSPSLLAVPSSPGALELGVDDTETDVFLNSIFNEADTHPEVTGAAFDPEALSTACGRALLAARSDSFDTLKQELQQEEDDTFASDDRAGSPLPSEAPMESHGEFAVSAPPKGKPLYGAPADAAERSVQALFPEWTLRLQRIEFNKWKKLNHTRKLTAAESAVLRRFRRTMLARVYADRARHRRAAKHGADAEKVDALQAENRLLRERLAVLEAQAARR